MNTSEQVSGTAITGCLDVCHRCAALVATIEAAGASGTAAFAAVGPHLRHCVDHFSALLRDLPTGPVDYDRRDRDPSLEADPARLLAALAAIETRLAAIPLEVLSRRLAVLQLAASGASPRAVDSTVERELVFLSSHTIHHLALMIQLAAAHGIAVPAELGVAFSTAAYRQEIASARR